MIKHSVFILFSILSLGFMAPGHAQKGDADGANCVGKTWPPLNDVACINKGGSVSCLNSAIVCCIANDEGGRTCSDNPDDLSVKTQPAPNRTSGLGTLQVAPITATSVIAPGTNPALLLPTKTIQAPAATTPAADEKPATKPVFKKIKAFDQDATPK